MKGDCPGASECKYIARDIWNLRHGQARILLAPQARTTYDIDAWKVMQKFAPAKRRQEVGEEALDLIAWNEVRAPEKVVCIPTRRSNGEIVDTWDENNERKKLPPLSGHGIRQLQLNDAT
jgi:hypothetical protein